MKRTINWVLTLLVALPFAFSCAEQPLDPNSIITVDNYEKNAFDLWLDANFVYPYNIEFKYRYRRDLHPHLLPQGILPDGRVGV